MVNDFWVSLEFYKVIVLNNYKLHSFIDVIENLIFLDVHKFYLEFRFELWIIDNFFDLR